MTDGTRIAVLGLGAMGRPVARRLMGARHAVTVWNRTPSSAHELVREGARQADTPAAAAAETSVIVLALADPAAVRGVLTGEQGVLRGARRGATVVDLSTVGPADSRAFAASCAEAGVRYVECPVLGSVRQAETGTLVALAAGDGAAIADVSPLLLVFARQIVRAGGPGQGSALKLVMNLLVGGITELVAESIEMAERAGLSRDVVRETLMSSVLASPFLGYKAPQLFDRQYAPLFSAQLMLKDMNLVLDFARQLGVPLAAAATIREQYARAVAAGHGAEDFAAVREVVGRAAPTDS